jgi:glutamate racemase
VGKTAAVIHTTSATIEPLKKLCKTVMPEVSVFHYLDDSLLPQINREGAITQAVKSRFFSLVQTAVLLKPDAVLCACSSVGELVEELREFTPVPFLRIDEPMARQAAAACGKVLVCATLASTLNPTLSLIKRIAKDLGGDISLESLLIKGAGELLAKGDLDGYDALLKEYYLKMAPDNDVIVLAQASMARAAEDLIPMYRQKFLSSPSGGIIALRDALGC